MVDNSNDDGLFEAVFGRKPKLASKEPDFSRTVRALKIALENTTPERAGVVWDTPKKTEEDEGPKVI